MSIIRKLAVLLFLMMLVVASVGYYALSPVTPDPLPMEFTLNQGSSLTAAARQFEQKGLLKSPGAFVMFARLLGRAGQLKAGVYRLDHPLSKLELLEMITQGSVSKTQVTVIEGWNLRQLRAALDAMPNLRHDSTALAEAELLQRIGASETHLEGLFYPDTYFVDAGSSDLELLKRAYQTMQQRLQQAWQTRDAGLPLESPYQALILASIVEKETGIPADRPMIAGVFIHRLRLHMMLQTDPAVIYGLGDKFDGNLRRRDLANDTPYNTYTRVGLPPTPIALPGSDALNAVLHPAKTDALYFVARGDGSSHFSATLDEHNRAVKKYQK
ncbi:MAG: endolytic transglycosylase MltG [Gallionella sp.]|nr:endolytic transglycosylase MltG [Gallionella sp.]MDD4947331.1 endolytic transglycosylase MltG [Gallionella sp.]MDD5613313.1 endolytic transglycosylase MltG [Gallionella sp.]